MTVPPFPFVWSSRNIEFSPVMCREHNYCFGLDSLSKTTDNLGPLSGGGKDQDDSAASAEPLEKPNDRVEAEESINVSLRSEGNNELPKTCEIHVSLETKQREGHVEKGMSSIVDNKVQDANMVESPCPNGEKVSYEFLVKWVGKSHVHNCWISESLLKVLAKRKLRTYKAKYGMAIINICEERWKQPQRLLALRPSKQQNR